MMIVGKYYNDNDNNNNIRCWSNSNSDSDDDARDEEIIFCIFYSVFLHLTFNQEFSL